MKAAGHSKPDMTPLTERAKPKSVEAEIATLCVVN